MVATYSNDFGGLWSLADHKIREFIDTNQRVALGVSGGADSIGLFHVFCDFLKQKKISQLVVFHINFGLRGTESEGDEAFVRELCARGNIPLRVFKPSSPILTSIQESAREFRLGVQKRLYSEGFIVALAHNLDDVAENIIIRLARGSSIENAAGMSYFDGTVFRPWLGASRSLIRQALKQRNLTWREDSSNDQTYYTRNRIRHEVMPVLNDLFPGASDRIAKSFLSMSPSPEAKNLTANQGLPMSFFASAALSTIEGLIHQYLEVSYGGRSPVPRQVVTKIASAIHKISTGLDGQHREFNLPQSRTLKITAREIRLSLSSDLS